MIDFHSHVIPGVDDGATDLVQAGEALRAMREQGVRALVTTPHLPGSLLTRPELVEAMERIDAAWGELRDMVAREMPELRIERGAEIALDAPAPDLSDPRVRLAGTSFALVEFPFMNVPPRSENAIYELRMKGWRPVIAHPERYSGVDSGLRVVEDWLRVGGLLQVNCASLLGRYGKNAERIAWGLLEQGWVSYLGSDYHARGRLSIADARAALVERGGEEQARLLMERNPALLLEDEAPEEVPPLEAPRKPLWARIWRR
jgi:protein-tyrosine phosphatase